jgi:hypothetical protein
MKPTQSPRPKADSDLIWILMVAIASGVTAWAMGRYFFAVAFVGAALVTAFKFLESP